MSDNKQVNVGHTTRWIAERVSLGVFIVTRLGGGCPPAPHTFGSMADARDRADDLNRPKCPDGGTCHHDCGDVCWRVRTCGPLSGVFPGDRWPDDVEAAHKAGDGRVRVEDIIVSSDQKDAPSV